MLTNGERDFVASANAVGVPPGGDPAGRREHELDMRDVPMPLAYVRLRRALERLAPGAQLMVAANDHESLRGFPVLARLCGHELVEQHEVGGNLIYMFRRR